MRGDRVSLEEGSGGFETSLLLKRLFKNYIEEKDPKIIGIEAMDDSSFIRFGKGYLVLSIDSYTVDPLFFPGGDLGKLAVTGTINDLAVAGAEPLGLMDTLVLEEGLDRRIAERIVDSMVSEARRNNVRIVGGDLKVMPRGQLDRVLVAMAGVGYTEKPIVDHELRVGDKIIVSGGIGEHGAVIAALRYGLQIRKDALRSDCASILPYMRRLVERYGKHIHAARDPTRGGLSALLNEWSAQTGKRIIVEEKKIPVSTHVRAVSEILGLEPVSLASEGRFVVAADPSVSEDIVEMLHSMGLGDASIIGEVVEGEPMVLMKTVIGSQRILDPAVGIGIPRIC